MIDFSPMNSTKNRILQAARTVLINQGSGGFSMRKVAAEAAITLGNVQYHYKTKTDLLSELMLWYVAEYKNGLLQTMNDVEAGKEGLRRFIEVVLSDEADSDEIKLSLAIVSCAEEQALTNQFAAFYDEFYALLADFLGRIAGKPVESSCIQTGASILLTVINGYGLVSQQLGINTQVMADELTTMIWNKVSNVEGEACSRLE